MGCNTGVSRESEFYFDSISGTMVGVNPTNVLVNDLSPSDGQTSAEEECPHFFTPRRSAERVTINEKAPMRA
jgi:hypothetical protein